MRILIAHAFYRLSGGEDRYVEQQVRLLRDHGHKARLLAKRNEALETTISDAQRMVYSHSAVKDARDAIQAFAPDVIHIHNVYPAFGPAVHIAARKERVPVVMTVHNFRLRCPNGYMFTEGKVCRRCEGGNYLHSLVHQCFSSRAQSAAYATSLWSHRFILHIDRLVDLFIAPSVFMEKMLQSWGIPGEKVRTIRNFTDVAPEGVRQAEDYGLYVGRLSSEKGLHILLQALRMAGDPPFKVVGGGPLWHSLLTLARDLDLRNVEFVGQVEHEEAVQLLRGARFLTIPSISDENAPLVGFEALANGVPLLVTRVGGLSELVDLGAAIGVPPSDAQATAVQVARLRSDSGLQTRLSEAGLRIARDLAPGNHINQLLSAYTAAVTSNRTLPAG